jgi:hypothetical protein
MPPSYRGEGQPALTEGQLAGVAWSEEAPSYRGQPTTSPAPQQPGGLLAGLQRLLSVLDAPVTPPYRLFHSTRAPKRARSITKNERPQKPKTP